MKYAMHAMLLCSLVSTIYTAEEEKKDPTLLSTHFDLGVDHFDDVVCQWHQDIANNIAKTAADTNTVTPLVVECTNLRDLGLNKAMESSEIRSRAQNHYKVIEQNAIVREALEVALLHSRVKNEKNKWCVQKSWKEFRQIAARSLKLQEQAAIPGIQYPDAGSPEAIEQWITRNEDLKPNDEQLTQYTALQIVLYSFRQVHRNCDPETDDANLLLAKEVTEQKK